MDPHPSLLQVRTVYNTATKLKLACKAHAIQANFEFVTVKSDKRRYTIKCKDEDCSWQLHATNVENTCRFRIRKLSETHDCFGLIHTRHKQVTNTFIATRIQDKLRAQPNYTPTQIRLDLKTELGVDISYAKAWRARELALNFINGTHEEAYAKLPGYCKDVLNTNPHTTAILERDDDGKFKRIFISYGASAMGFGHCLPILGLDGTHLKSKYLSILLAATGVDAVGSLYPLAFAVVDAENDANWLWFLSILRKHVLEPHASENLENGTLVLLSDRQKGLIDGVASVFPGLRHGYCLRHLEENFHKQFKNVELKKLLWRAARSTQKEDFDAALQEMRGINAVSASWLLAHAPPEHWAELYFAGHRYGHLTSNIAESLNSWLLHARELPILAMFECIRHQLMDWYCKRRGGEGNTVGLLVKPIAEKLQQLVKDRACRYRFHASTSTRFEVSSGITMVDYLVDLETRTCSCHVWQSSGYPCGHAIAIIMALKRNPQLYSKTFFTLESYRKSYENAILHPLAGDYSQPLVWPSELGEDEEIDDGSDGSDDGDVSEPEDNSMLPPRTRRPTGRPKKRRIRSTGESETPTGRQHRQNHCGRCRGLGHSKRTCREAI